MYWNSTGVVGWSEKSGLSGLPGNISAVSFHFVSFLLNKVRLPRIGSRRASYAFFLRERVCECVGPIH